MIVSTVLLAVLAASVGAGLVVTYRPPLDSVPVMPSSAVD